MMDLMLRLRALMITLHPRGRRWLRFLHSFELDPDELPIPLPQPTSRDFIICGAPRSGTTLLTAILFQQPHIVTIMEPWSGMRLPPKDLFASIRNEIDETGKLTHGRLDLGELTDSGLVRWIKEGSVPYEVRVNPDYHLGIKWPAFWRYVGLLPDTKFLICLRDPKEVVASFKRTRGRLALGLSYDVAFDDRINKELSRATRSLALRRVLLYEKINAHILPYLGQINVMPIRYERWFTDPDKLISEISSFLDVPLGMGHVRIRQPKAKPSLSNRELHMLTQHCGSMRKLGYSV